MLTNDVGPRTGPGGDGVPTNDVGPRPSPDELVLFNMGLVGMVARRYVDRGLEWDDLCQEGMIGLVEASRRFDPDRPNPKRPGETIRFSTYAYFWIKQGIVRALLVQPRMIAVPVDLAYMLARIRKGLVDRDGLPPGTRRRLEDAERAQDGPVHPERWALEEGLLAPEVRPPPASRDDSLIGRLDGLEREVVRAYYGFGSADGTGEAMGSIGLRVGLTRPQVQAVLSHALGRLRRQLAPAGRKGVMPCDRDAIGTGC